MKVPSRSTAYDTRMGMNFNNVDDMEPSNHTFQPVRLTSSNYEYQHEERGNEDRRQTSKSERRGCCSKKCLIGLAIGLAIGVLLVIIIAVPIGVTKKYSLGTISSTPNWIGTFQADNACDTTGCCCFSNAITVSTTSNNQIQIAGSVAGQCNGFPSTLSQTTSIPTGFQTTPPSSGESIRFQLGQDSSYISYVNLNYAVCSGSALRTSYNAGNIKNMNMGLVMFILSITVGIMM